MGILTLACPVVVAFPLKMAYHGFIFGRLYKEGREEGRKGQQSFKSLLLQVILEIEAVLLLVVSAFLPSCWKLRIKRMKRS